MNIDKKLKVIIKLAIFTLIYSYGILWLDESLLIILFWFSYGFIIFVIPILFILIFLRSCIYIIMNRDIKGGIPILILIVNLLMLIFLNPLYFKVEENQINIGESVKIVENI